LDNEAGLENLSRRIVQKVDLLVMVTDPSQKGLETVTRLHILAKEMEIKYDRLALIVNRLRSDEFPKKVSDVKNAIGADFLIGLPDNAELAEIAENGLSLTLLSGENEVVKRVDGFLDEIGFD
ncbi:MAG: hypothetical protein K8R68_03630, partial [Bacteroidales bacterium]|nr:hypothetical protein [Bacteroidales bacterium]